MPTCEYVLVNRNRIQKLTDLFSVLVFEAICIYIHPTRYKQIIETQSAEFLLPREQKWISEDQKHSSNVARVHYQKKRSREVAMRGRWCMEKLVVESKNMDKQYEKIQHSSAVRDDVRQDTSIVCTPQLTLRRKGIRLTPEEDNCIRLGIEQFGLCWSKILRHSEFNFNACHVPNTLRKRAEAFKLV